MKRVISAFALLLAATLSHAEPVALDRIVAIVDEDAITNSELEAEMNAVKLQLRQQSPTLPANDVLQKQVLERLILKHLKQQIATRNNIIVDDETLNRSITSIAQQNNLSLAQLRAVLEKDGLDFNAYRESIRDEILHARLRQRYVDNHIKITNAEVDQFLQQQQANSNSEQEYRLGHILISLPEGAAAEQIREAKARGEKILQQLADGKDFAEMAVAQSDGQMALQGGDLGWRKLGEIPSLFAKTALQLKVGEVSTLVRSASGFHILKLMEQRGGERHVVTQTHVRHILIKTNEIVNDAEAKKKLLDLKARIENGDNFATLAKAHSDDKGSASKGGNLGWANPGQMVRAFETAMNEAKPNVITEPFQSQFGWHILEVLGRRDHDDTEQFKRNQARNQLFERKAVEEEELWLRRLRDEAYVEIRL